MFFMFYIREEDGCTTIGNRRGRRRGSIEAMKRKEKRTKKTKRGTTRRNKKMANK